MAVNDYTKTIRYRNFLNKLKKGTPLERDIVTYMELMEKQILELNMLLKKMEAQKAANDIFDDDGK